MVVEKSSHDRVLVTRSGRDGAAWACATDYDLPLQK